MSLRIPVARRLAIALRKLEQRDFIVKVCHLHDGPTEKIAYEAVMMAEQSKPPRGFVFYRKAANKAIQKRQDFQIECSQIEWTHPYDGSKKTYGLPVHLIAEEVGRVLAENNVPVLVEPGAAAVTVRLAARPFDAEAYRHRRRLLGIDPNRLPLAYGYADIQQQLKLLFNEFFSGTLTETELEMHVVSYIADFAQLKSVGDGI